MPRGCLSVRVDHTNQRHHIWNNNGVWWVHYTVHFDGRKRRVRRSLKTRDEPEAMRRRDELLDQLDRWGEFVAERRACAAAAPSALAEASRTDVTITCRIL
jgi:hypothetical protein